MEMARRHYRQQQSQQGNHIPDRSDHNIEYEYEYTTSNDHDDERSFLYEQQGTDNERREEPTTLDATSPTTVDSTDERNFLTQSEGRRMRINDNNHDHDENEDAVYPSFSNDVSMEDETRLGSSVVSTSSRHHYQKATTIRSNKSVSRDDFSRGTRTNDDVYSDVKAGPPSLRHRLVQEQGMRDNSVADSTSTTGSSQERIVDILRSAHSSHSNYGGKHIISSSGGSKGKHTIETIPTSRSQSSDEFKSALSKKFSLFKQLRKESISRVSHGNTFDNHTESSANSYNNDYDDDFDPAVASNDYDADGGEMDSMKSSKRGPKPLAPFYPVSAHSHPFDECDEDGTLDDSNPHQLYDDEYNKWDDTKINDLQHQQLSESPKQSTILHLFMKKKSDDDNDDGDHRMNRRNNVSKEEEILNQKVKQKDRTNQILRGVATGISSQESYGENIYIPCSATATINKTKANSGNHGFDRKAVSSPLPQQVLGGRLAKSSLAYEDNVGIVPDDVDDQIDNSDSDTTSLSWDAPTNENGGIGGYGGNTSRDRSLLDGSKGENDDSTAILSPDYKFRRRRRRRRSRDENDDDLSSDYDDFDDIEENETFNDDTSLFQNGTLAAVENFLDELAEYKGIQKLGGMMLRLGSCHALADGTTNDGSYFTNSPHKTKKSGKSATADHEEFGSIRSTDIFPTAVARQHKNRGRSTSPRSPKQSRTNLRPPLSKSFSSTLQERYHRRDNDVSIDTPEINPSPTKPPQTYFSEEKLEKNQIPASSVNGDNSGTRLNNSLMMPRNEHVQHKKSNGGDKSDCDDNDNDNYDTHLPDKLLTSDYNSNNHHRSLLETLFGCTRGQY